MALKNTCVQGPIKSKNGNINFLLAFGTFKSNLATIQDLKIFPSALKVIIVKLVSLFLNAEYFVACRLGQK